MLRIDGVNEATSKYVSIQEEIMDSSESRSIILFQRENWIRCLGLNNPEELTRVGGFSGGPALIFKDGILELVGVISQDGGSLFDIQIVNAKYIKPDGTIGENI